MPFVIHAFAHIKFREAVKSHDLFRRRKWFGIASLATNAAVWRQRKTGLAPKKKELALKREISFPAARACDSPVSVKGTLEP